MKDEAQRLARKGQAEQASEQEFVAALQHTWLAHVDDAAREFAAAASEAKVPFDGRHRRWATG